ncbi:specifically androgen-regulated gene protein isoform X1 [Neoarius graeffei]|uniref:specifically androgen-regulated gene protein isoform X1 n=1 Tax=Neoarius graeffei TaxID=443677 RepID=UPI00298D1027|nr:specifically androgen-regulated gene protein isoform X1 [Neoarius graeffei]
MKRRVEGYTDSTNSCDRIINFNSQASDVSLQHLSAEEKALMFLEETIKSIVTEDDIQSSGNTISKSHHVTRGVHQDRSSCNSFPVPGSLDNLSAEEKACLKFLDETIDSIEDGGLSTDDTESLPESRNTIVQKHNIHQKKYLVPTPFVQATGNGNVPLKQGMASPKVKPPPNKDNSPENDQPSSDHASYLQSLSSDHLVELCKNISMIKTSTENQPSTQIQFNQPQNIPESGCRKPSPPAIAPKPKIPSHIAIDATKETTTIPNPSADLQWLPPENCGGLIPPDKAKLEALSKLGLLKEDGIPENKQGLDAPLSSSFPAWSQKNQEKSGLNLESSLSNDEQLALQKLSQAISLSLPMAADVGEDRRWALRKLGLLKD